MVPPVEVAKPVLLICPAAAVLILLEFVVSIPLVLEKESAMPSMRIVVVACSVEEAVRRAWRVMFFCESKSPATRPEFKMQEPPIAKQPLVRLMPFANVEVAVVEVTLSASAWRAVAKVEVPVDRLGMERSVVEAEFTTSNAFPVDAELPQTESRAYGEVVPMPTRELVEKKSVEVAVSAVPFAA